MATTLFKSTLRNSIFKRNYYKPSFPRDSRYSKVNSEDVRYFKQILTPTGVLTSEGDAQALDLYNQDWMNKYKGNSSVVLRPKTTEQVSSILKYCNERKLAVVPQGGNTGLVGGSVPVFDEIVITTALMNKIERFDPVAGMIVTQAGVVLEELDNYLAKQNCTVPLDLGAKGSCHIGGNVATNAGGLRLLRYGSLHGSVLGLEVVLADGTILDTCSTVRKDNTGYDLKQLFIGSEGTLGIITKVAILTPPKPKSVRVSFFGLKSFEDVKKTFAKAKGELGEILSAVEFADRRALEFVLKHIPHARDPFQSSHPFYMLIETSGSNETHDEEKLNTFLEKLMGESALVGDGTISNSQKGNEDLWRLRETIAEALKKAGAVYKYDVSLPLDNFYELVEVLRERLAKKAVVVGYGHVGDGNLHLNVSAPKYDDEVFNLIEPFLYEWIAKYRGSISAEHGIGMAKPQFLHYSKSWPAIQLMSKLKNTLDPNAILNPYKLFPSKQNNFLPS